MIYKSRLTLYSYSVETYVGCPACEKINRLHLDQIKKGPKCGACKEDIKLQGFSADASPKILQSLIQKTPLPVVVQFWASGSDVCQTFRPVFAVASETWGAGHLSFAQINTEQFAAATVLYKIESIPTLLLFKDGKEKGRISGGFSNDNFHQWVDQLLG